MMIEKMRTQESEMVSRLVANAFFEKFTGKTYLTKAMLQTILKLIWIEEADSFGMTIYTVKSEGEVMGAFGVTSRKKSPYRLRLLAKTCAVIKRIGLKEFLSFLKTGLQTSRTPEHEEWYIDFIVVKENVRNQNIGHMIMSALDGMVSAEPDISHLSLYVLKGNKRAIHLYEKHGFLKDPVRSKDTYHFMVKQPFRG